MRTARLRTPLIPISLCAALMLAACGSDDSVSSPDGSLLPPVAVNVAGAGAGGDGVATMDAAEGSVSDEDRSISSMPAFAGYVFEVGEGLPALPTNSTGYHYPAGVTVDAAEVTRVAAALGVDGEPLESSGAPELGYQWRVGPDDGSAPALFVADDGQLSWYYSNAWAETATTGCGVAGSDGATVTDVDPQVAVESDVADEPGVATDPALSVPPEGTVEGEQPIDRVDCATPEPPAGVPTADEATALATDLLAAIGEDPAAYELETYADEWSASVTAYTTVDGVRWPSGIGFGFGAEGALQWANGTFADPVAAGPYPLIDLDTAIARLSEQNGFWGYGGGDVLAMEVDTPEIAATSDVQRLPAPTDDGTTPPDPEPIVATLVDVRADLWWVWDTDNSVWLLPAYTFTDTAGNQFTVPAVTDDYMIVVEPTPTEPEPAPVEPAPTDVPSSDVPSSDVPSSDVPSTDVVAPNPGTTADAAVLDEFVGATLPEFEAAAERYGFTTRVARQDGVDLALTMDYLDTRVNVAVEGDVVVEVISFG